MSLYLKPSLSKDFPHYVVRKSILHLLKENLNRFKGDVIDLGCGIMPYKQLILSENKVKSYIGIDLKVNPEQNVYPDICWDGKTIPVESESIDAVLLTEVIEHLKNPAEVLLEVKRILKKDGIIIGSTPFFWPLHEVPNDNQRFSPYGLEHLLQQEGFSSITITAAGGWNVSMAQFLSTYIQFGVSSPLIKKIYKALFYFPIIWLSSSMKTITAFENKLMINLLFFTAIKKGE
jgi:SAM-dependent methyltransferase